MRRYLPILLVLGTFALLPVVQQRVASTETRGSFYDNGQLREESAVRVLPGGKTIRHGRFLAFTPEGQVSITGHYDDGEMSDTWRYFDISGRLIAIADYDDGRGFQRSLREDGSILRRGPVIRSIRHGEWIEYYESGRIKMKGNFMNGLQDGRWQAFTDENSPQLRVVQFSMGEVVE